MDIIYNILVALICLFFGYIMGSISFSIIIGKVFYHQDPRDFGSKNAGGTNAGRLWGKKVGLLIIILDMAKTICPMWICWAILTYAPMNNGMPICVPTSLYYSPFRNAYLIQWPVYLLANLGCAIGHCWPLFSNFKGGKGVSAFMGTILGSSWGLGWVPAGLIYFPVLKKTKYVSLTSVIMGFAGSLIAWIWAILAMTHVIPAGYENIVGYGNSINLSWHYALVITLIAILMAFRHKANFERIKAGTEHKIKWMK